MPLYGESCEQYTRDDDSPGETIPRAHLAKLPGVTLSVMAMAADVVAVPFYSVMAILTGSPFAVLAAVLFTLAFVFQRRVYRRTIIRRNELRKANFWTAMDFVIKTEPPERSPELAELERPYEPVHSWKIKTERERAHVHEASAVMKRWDPEPGTWRDPKIVKLSKSKSRKIRRKANRERYLAVVARWRQQHHCEQEPCRHKPDHEYLAVAMRENIIIAIPELQMGQPRPSRNGGGEVY